MVVEVSKKQELELAVLTPEEELLGYLNPDLVELTEVEELGGLRSIDITYPLVVKETDNVLPIIKGDDRVLEITVNGAGSGLTDGIAEVTISHEIGMASDFSNITVLYADDTEVEYSLIHKTDNDNIKLALSMDIPASGSTTTLYCIWGAGISFNPTATPNYAYFDDFEDGLYTGRSSPYLNWTVRNGIGSITSRDKINGVYSLKHYGNSVDTHDTVMTFPFSDTSYTVRLNVKLQTKGSMIYTPYIIVWVLRYTDVNNWVRVDTYWDSTTSKQKVRLIKMVSGTHTIIESYDWLGAYLPEGSTNRWTIIDEDGDIRVYIDTTLVLDTSYTFSGGTSYKGIGANMDTTVVVDTIVITGDNVWGLITTSVGEPVINQLDVTDLTPSMLLHHGNKIWRQTTGNGNSCLYVLLEGKEVNPKNNTISICAEEVATELSMLPPVRFNTSTSKITINSAFLTTYFGDLFTAGDITGAPAEFAYNGTIGRMALIREIEKQTGCEFEFEYSYSNSTGLITRTINYLQQKGATHTDKIELGYNADNIILNTDEGEVGIAAAPVGSPKDSEKATVDTFHQARKAFEDLVVSKTTAIPLWVTKDESGNTVNGPTAYPPYAKSAGQNYVASPIGESAANYREVNKKEGSSTTVPRTILFESSEENAYNLYWLCVDKIRDKQHPSVKLDAQVIDIQLLRDYIATYYNVGDTVYLQLPGYKEIVEARVMKTTKNPREPGSDDITIGNYKIDFFADYFNAGGIIIEPYRQV